MQLPSSLKKKAKTAFTIAAVAGGLCGVGYLSAKMTRQVMAAACGDPAKTCKKGADIMTHIALGLRAR